MVISANKGVQVIVKGCFARELYLKQINLREEPLFLVQDENGETVYNGRFTYFSSSQAVFKNLYIRQQNGRFPLHHEVFKVVDFYSSSLEFETVNGEKTHAKPEDLYFLKDGEYYPFCNS